VKRLERSTSVPIAEWPRPRMRSPSQWPGTARSSASAGRSLIMISSLTKFLAVCARALGTLSARPVRRHAVSSRRSAPRLMLRLRVRRWERVRLHVDLAILAAKLSAGRGEASVGLLAT
jgi:hypothetical protein